MTGGEARHFGAYATLCPLSWDTAFFGFPCARLNLSGAPDEADFLSALAAASQYPFLCIANGNNNSVANRLIARHTTAFLADTNVQFLKTNLLPAGEQTLFAADCYAEDADILRIAKSVFTASRFVTDERLRAAGGSEVYVQWARNAFHRAGKYYLTEKKDGCTVGFMLFSEEDDFLRLELIGVDETLQACGIGTRLWHNLECEALAHQKTGIAVGTQLANTNAIRYYTGRGCRMQSCSTVYHRWQ